MASPRAASTPCRIDSIRANGSGPSGVHHTREVFATQKLHHEVQVAVVGAPEVYDPNAVRVVEAAGRRASV